MHGCGLFAGCFGRVVGLPDRCGSRFDTGGWHFGGGCNVSGCFAFSLVWSRVDWSPPHPPPINLPARWRVGRHCRDGLGAVATAGIGAPRHGYSRHP